MRHPADQSGQSTSLEPVYDDLWDKATDQLYVNTDLWERLIHGDCARVVVLGPSVGRSMLELYFPQMLGLPPLRRFFSYSTPEELAAEATRLAATDRWIAEGEIWAESFLPRAEVILSVETERLALMARPTGARLSTSTLSRGGYAECARNAGAARHPTSLESPWSTWLPSTHDDASISSSRSPPAYARLRRITRTS